MKLKEEGLTNEGIERIVNFDWDVQLMNKMVISWKTKQEKMLSQTFLTICCLINLSGKQQLWRNHVTTSIECLALFNCNKDEFLRRFVTVDETWMHHNTPETKQNYAMNCSLIRRIIRI